MFTVSRGPDFDTQLEAHATCKVSDLLSELYEKAGHAKQWWLVRHTAGMMRKQVEDLANAATDIIVRMKQLAVGLPPEPREKIITRLEMYSPIISVETARPTLSSNCSEVFS